MILEQTFCRNSSKRYWFRLVVSTTLLYSYVLQDRDDTDAQSKDLEESFAMIRTDRVFIRLKSAFRSSITLSC